MSNLPYNPYVERLVTDGAPRTSESLATLALAYEQRNVALAIIATSTHSDGTYALDPAVVDEAQDQLKARLGLGENK